MNFLIVSSSLRTVPTHCVSYVSSSIPQEELLNTTAVQGNFTAEHLGTIKLLIFENRTVLQNRVSMYMVPKLRFLKSFSVQAAVITVFRQATQSPNETPSRKEPETQNWACVTDIGLQHPRWKRKLVWTLERLPRIMSWALKTPTLSLPLHPWGLHSNSFSSLVPSSQIYIPLLP